jgi:hypothetical protein
LGLQRYALFFNLQIFLQNFQKNFAAIKSQRQSSKELPAFTATRFSKGVQRYTLFFNLQTFQQQFLTFFDVFMPKKPL